MSDRLTLRWTGRWAARHGVSSCMISHERVDRLLDQLRVPPCPGAAGRRPAQRALVAEFDTVVCATPTIVTAMQATTARTVTGVAVMCSPNHSTPVTRPTTGPESVRAAGGQREAERTSRPGPPGGRGEADGGGHGAPADDGCHRDARRSALVGCGLRIKQQEQARRYR